MPRDPSAPRRGITLEPWAPVEGIFRVGRDPVANVPITLNLAGRDSFGTDPPHIVTHHDVPTGDYSLRVRFERDDAGFLQGHRFQVPPPEGDPAALPVDLGTMKLRASALR